MSRKRSHKDVEFSVNAYDGTERIFRTWDEAAGFVLAMAASDGKHHNLNVLIYSRAGANWWGGDDAVEEWESDPDASVSDRIVVKAESHGRIA